MKMKLMSEKGKENKNELVYEKKFNKIKWEKILMTFYACLEIYEKTL